jgi:hypothetical protein
MPIDDPGGQAGAAGRGGAGHPRKAPMTEAEAHQAHLLSKDQSRRFQTFKTASSAYVAKDSRSSLFVWAKTGRVCEPLMHADGALMQVHGACSASRQVVGRVLNDLADGGEQGQRAKHFLEGYRSFDGAPASCATLARFLQSAGVEDAFEQWSRAETAPAAGARAEGMAAAPAAGARAAGMAAVPAAGERAAGPPAARALRSVLSTDERGVLSQMFEQFNSGSHNLDDLASRFMEAVCLNPDLYNVRGDLICMVESELRLMGLEWGRLTDRQVRPVCACAPARTHTRTHTHTHVRAR